MIEENVDSELKAPLEMMLDTWPGLSAEGLREIRDGLDAMSESILASRPHSVGVEDRLVPGPFGGSELRLRIYRPRDAEVPLPVLYWMHGGGMVIGSVDLDDGLLANAVDRHGFTAVSVDYRLAPEHPDPTPIEDCYAGLSWISSHADTLQIDPDRIAVGGPSAGGGLAAGLALLARDRSGPHIAFQLLLEPMLDDRSTTRSSTQYDGTTLWDRNDNQRGWNALLGDRTGTDGVSHYAAPARAAELRGLPAAFIDVGEIETFRDECIDYATRLSAAGVPTEFHLYSGAFHGFDLIAPESWASRRAWYLRWSAVTRALGCIPPDPPAIE
jgi:acetyl esterase/lipase